MKPTTAVTLLLTALVFLLAFYLHDEAHRYDVVVAGAGSGGSQTDAGSTEIVGYLVDHKTGRVWWLKSNGKLPLRVLDCTIFGKGTKDTEQGCVVSPTETAPKNP